LAADGWLRLDVGECREMSVDKREEAVEGDLLLAPEV
jgi:hypothetical protein